VETDIGLIATVGMIFQAFWSITAGWITDRLGRKRTSLVFDTISWTLPTLLWTFAGGFTWFFAAAALNSAVRVVHISWSCLFIEDSEPDSRVVLYAWISVAGTLSGFFAPIAGLLVDKIGLVPATRALYAFAFATMTAMFWIRNAFVAETRVGKRRMEEARGHGVREVLVEYVLGAKSLFSSRIAVVALALSILSNVHVMVRANFLSVILTKGIGLSEGMVSVFPPLASAVTLAAYFLVVPRIKRMRVALFASLALSASGNLLLLVSPTGSLPLVFLSTLLVALGTGTAGPVIDASLANAIDDERRAKVLSVVYTLMFALSAPFGWISGLIARSGARLPSALAAVLMLLGAALALLLKKEGETERA
jgi:MFS transporter, DHA1 family, tetracycline resistance protein